MAKKMGFSLLITLDSFNVALHGSLVLRTIVMVRATRLVIVNVYSAIFTPKPGIRVLFGRCHRFPRLPLVLCWQPCFRSLRNASWGMTQISSSVSSGPPMGAFSSPTQRTTGCDCIRVRLCKSLVRRVSRNVSMIYVGIHGWMLSVAIIP